MSQFNSAKILESGASASSTFLQYAERVLSTCYKHAVKEPIIDRAVDIHFHVKSLFENLALSGTSAGVLFGGFMFLTGVGTGVGIYGLYKKYSKPAQQPRANKTFRKSTFLPVPSKVIQKK